MFLSSRSTVYNSHEFLMNIKHDKYNSSYWFPTKDVACSVKSHVYSTKAII
jgi:hypothetical protein